MKFDCVHDAGNMEKEIKRTRLYSRRGDLGETSLLYGPRVGKDHRRIELAGTIEELIARIGWVRALGVDSDVDKVLKRLVYRLREVEGEALSITPVMFEVRIVTEADIKAIEKVIDQWDAKLAPRRIGFMSDCIPGGTVVASALFIARTDCRRCERRACALLRFDPEFSPRVGTWLNRVVDLLYVLARFENMRKGVVEEEYGNEIGEFNDF